MVSDDVVACDPAMPGSSSSISVCELESEASYGHCRKCCSSIVRSVPNDTVDAAHSAQVQMELLVMGTNLYIIGVLVWRMCSHLANTCQS